MNNTTSYVQAKKALVIGGGIAGLLAARTLSEYYDVLIIERDDCPEKPGTRSGTPQSFHLHQVLPRGEIIMERMFPGFTAELLAAGASPMQNTMFQVSNRYGTLALPGGEGITYSRGLLEWQLRQQVHSLPRVSFLYHHDVTGLETSADSTRVTGVHLRQRGQLEQQTTLTADLVVDASGRSSRLPQWLSASGYQLPEDERVTSSIGYSTRYYKIPPHKRGSVSVMVVENNPMTGNAAGGVIKAIEDDTWAVCLSGVDGRYPPMDAQEFEEAFTHLISPMLAETLRGAEPLTEPRGYRIPECIRHHYEQMEQWPAGLLVLGDALCHFDPVYGQGMAVAAIEAETLATCLREQHERPDLERYILKQMQEALYPAWWLSTLEDLRWPGVAHIGAEPLQNAPLLHKYFDLCLKQMTQQFSASHTGNFNPLFMNYFMMNAFLVSPRDVINANMLTALLEAGDSLEGQAVLAELAQYNQPIEAVLDEIVPAFTLATINLPLPAPDGEVAASHP